MVLVINFRKNLSGAARFLNMACQIRSEDPPGPRLSYLIEVGRIHFLGSDHEKSLVMFSSFSGSDFELSLRRSNITNPKISLYMCTHEPYTDTKNYPNWFEWPNYHKLKKFGIKHIQNVIYSRCLRAGSVLRSYQARPLLVSLSKRFVTVIYMPRKCNIKYVCEATSFGVGSLWCIEYFSRCCENTCIDTFVSWSIITCVR